MSRPPLPPEARRVQVRITLSPAAEAALDAMAAERATTRSALVEQLVLDEVRRLALGEVAIALDSDTFEQLSRHLAPVRPAKKRVAR